MLRANRSAGWQPDGKSIALTDRAGRVQLLDAQTEETRLLGSHKTEAATVAFSPDGRYLFSGGWERELICWDMRTRQRAFVVGLDSYHLQFSADGRRCALLTESMSTRGVFEKLSLHDFEQPADPGLLGVQFRFRTIDGTPRATGADYLAIPGSPVLLTAGPVAPITVSVLADTRVEPDEMSINNIFLYDFPRSVFKGTQEQAEALERTTRTIECLLCAHNMLNLSQFKPLTRY